VKPSTTKVLAAVAPSLIAVAILFIVDLAGMLEIPPSRGSRVMSAGDLIVLVPARSSRVTFSLQSQSAPEAARRRR